MPYLILPGFDSYSLEQLKQAGSTARPNFPHTPGDPVFTYVVSEKPNSLVRAWIHCCYQETGSTTSAAGSKPLSLGSLPDRLSAESLGVSGVPAFCWEGGTYSMEPFCLVGSALCFDISICLILFSAYPF